MPARTRGSSAEALKALQARVARQTQRLEALIEVNAAIASARGLDELLSTVVERLTGLLRASAATVFLHDVERDELWSRALKARSVKEIRIPASQGLAGHVLATGRALLVADAYSDPRFSPATDQRTGFRTRSIIAAPLQTLSGDVVGVLEVLDDTPGVFTPEDRGVVEAVARLVANVLGSVRLQDALTQRSRELAERVKDLDVLYEVEREISSAGQGVDLIDRILARALDLTGALAGSVLVADAEADSLYFRSAAGERREQVKRLRLRTGQGIGGHVALSGEVVRLERAADSPHFDRSISRKLKFPVQAVLCAPISAEGGRLGALELFNKRGGFTEADERLVVLLAGQLGRALEVNRDREEGERKGRLAAIGQMLAGVLHDLRTPLTVVGGYAELLRDEDDPRTRSAMVQAILSQLEHLQAMQGETLAFARGERTVLLRKVFMHLFAQELEEQLGQELGPRGVKLEVKAHYTGSARVDETALKRVVYNLARNAADAMGEGGRFTLEISREGPELVLKARDTGPGIPDELAPRLFDWFVTGGKENGTGLGLAIVKKIVDEHGGTVRFTSRPGKGTTFEIRLPARSPED